MLRHDDGMTIDTRPSVATSPPQPAPSADLNPGTWVWHCHILDHVERETGMLGMVTAIVVR